jgi:glycerophosphoryl diester phosphodiesterase
MPHIVFFLARILSLLCLVVLGVVGVFDAQTERFTSGRVPLQTAGGLNVSVVADPGKVVAVAHNAGDDLRTATRAVAYGADVIEIDVRSSGGELVASHDAPVLEDVAFRGPSLSAAWKVAQLRETVLLHLKERSAPYLDRVRAFVASRPRRHVIVQTEDVQTLRTVRRTMPSARRLLLLFNHREVEALRADRTLLDTIDGVSVRDSLLSAELQAWLEHRGLLTFAWTVNDPQRVNELVARGLDGVITDRLDVMRRLGERQNA